MANDDARGSFAFKPVRERSGRREPHEILEDHARKLGYSVDRDASKLSESKYLTLSHDKLPDQTIRVRVSGHDLPPSYGSPGDYDVDARGSSRAMATDWASTSRALARRVGADVLPAAKRVLGAREKEEASRRQREAEMNEAAYRRQQKVLEQRGSQDAKVGARGSRINSWRPRQG